ncbi:unnamed protein product [Fusarium graminearum]|uniref:Chromosome 1, complete genome n=1 Tax=Gibberella zeae (strain ATCC MYA-4620 / CBS 123657 / FGSC 9075 / NRRL 31084 / PH-1) TaxID=229533 RepID=A0A098D7G6_GIBZE|nr:unnamed protein product [Fusarium graminearum]CZS78177.1 unnamed protein product [Fusarium graminearum]
MSVWGCVASAIPALSSDVLWCPLVSSQCDQQSARRSYSVANLLMPASLRASP